jgi:photosystem II stability/assembly factor-like uncharacterized protein
MDRMRTEYAMYDWSIPRARVDCGRALLGLAICTMAMSSAAVGGTAAAWHTVQTEPYPKKRDDIVFIDPRIGFYGTGKGRLFRTEDGGHSWQLAWEHAGTFIRSLGFIDAKRGFLGNLGLGLGATMDPVPLYRTTDGGMTWQPAVSDAIQMAGVCAIDIVKAHAIVEGEVRERVIVSAAGRANGPAKMLRSEDGGETWRLIDLSDRAGMILDVKFLDPDVGFVFAGTNSDVALSRALILGTRDGGLTWREVYRSTRSHEIIWKASFPSAQTGYATLQSEDESNVQQRLLKSTDGGNHWLELPLVRNSAAQEFGIGFVDARHGWIGTAAGGFETRDGGKVWRSSDLAPKANKIRTHAADSSPMVYAIGSEVQLYSSGDSGGGAP